MEPGPDKNHHSLMLLQAAAELGSLEEKREFLNAVCEGEPVLLATLAETVTMENNLPRPPPASDSDMTDLSPGELIADRFHIVRRLGEGGMAVVYEAFDKKLGERRALKFPKWGHDAHIPEEARQALRVTHDNVCRTHEIHTANTRSAPADFLSMELVKGETLFTRLKREPVPAQEAIEIARQLCQGLKAAHEAQVLHRDLKTNNVMLARHRDGSLRAVIMDFGLALPLGNARRPAASKFGGTPNYIAPERWKGGEATPASDVYALGVILYEILTGGLPFADGTPWPRRLSELPPPPSRSDRNPDARWDSIVLGCLQPDPTKRFSSASEVLSAIERAFHGSSRRKWLVAAAVAVFALTPLAVFRERIWPPPQVRLAVMPLQGSAGNAAVDQAAKGALYDVARRLESLGSASKRLVAIPLDDSLRYQVTTPMLAAARLGATHVLLATLEAREGGFGVRAAIADTHTGLTLHRFSGDFRSTDVAALPVALAGVVTSAFHLGHPPPAQIRPEAYPYFAAGLASLRAIPPNPDKAIAAFEEAVKRDGSAAPALSGLADALLEKYRLGRDGELLKRSKALLERAASLQPDSPAVLLTSGALEQYQGRGEHAVQLFRRAAELEPSNSEAWRRAGIALQSIGNDTEAIETLQRSVQLAPGYYAPHHALGAVYYRTGHFSEAVEEFRTLTQIAPGLAEGFSYLGAALSSAEKYAEAEQALRQSLRLQSTRGALNNLGALLRISGREAEAAPVFEQALRVGADDAGLRLNLGNALRRLGRADEARKHFERANELSRAALQTNPRDAAARARLSYGMVRLGMTAMAADEALQAARLSPTDYSVLLWTVMTLDASGRREDALPLLSEARYERLRDLMRQPELAQFVRDPRFVMLLQQAQKSQTNPKRSSEDLVRTY